MNVQILNCFATSQANSGNPAAIVTDCTWSKAEKQAYATQSRLPATVFITQAKDKIPVLEYFYLSCEMPMCLHGTLGAAKVLFSDTGAKQLECATASGLTLTLLNTGKTLQVKVSQQPVPDVIVSDDIIFHLLNLNDSSQIDRSLPLIIASVGSAKLFIPLNSLSALMALKPNTEAIREWSIANKVQGLYVYTREVYRDAKLQGNNIAYFHARAFNPQGGHPEDAATGVAASALAACLKSSLIIEQGYIMQRPSEITVTYKSANEIWVGGKVKERSFTD